jgi:hypothetical protein
MFRDVPGRTLKRHQLLLELDSLTSWHRYASAQIGSVETELLAVLGPLTVVGSASARGGRESLILLRAVGPPGTLLPTSRISPGDQVALGSSVQMALAEELALPPSGEEGDLPLEVEQLAGTLAGECVCVCVLEPSESQSASPSALLSARWCGRQPAQQ